MMQRQIELVQSSFELIRKDAESAVMLFYDRLFQLDPSLRQMFSNTREEQARKLAHVLTVVVKGLSRAEQILPAVEELGRRHANYGVRPEHYATVGAALLWTLGAGLGDQFTPEVREAWTSAYLLLSSTMQRAAAEAGTMGTFATAQHAWTEFCRTEALCVPLSTGLPSGGRFCLTQRLGKSAPHVRPCQPREELFCE